MNIVENSAVEKKLKVDTLVRVIAEGSFKGFISTVCNVNPIHLSHAGGEVFCAKYLEIIDEEELQKLKQQVHDGDLVKAIGYRNVFTVKKVHTIFECESEVTMNQKFSVVVPVTEEERVAYIMKRSNELREKGTALLQESLALVSSLVKDSNSSPLAAPAAVKP
jgi:hypothetical protein